jgi:cyclomaltodextrinase / maltogenic alpha-amylase / neopullulanase
MFTALAGCAPSRLDARAATHDAPSSAARPEPASPFEHGPPTEVASDDGWWSRGVVLYGVYPPLFGDQPLRDVRERLDDLDALGVDALWLSPIMEAADPEDFGYAVTDYLRVRPEFGTEEDLRELVDDAHARDMRVILDFVPNHTSIEHPWFSDASRHDYYRRDEQGRAQHYFDWTHLPNLDYDHPEVERAMLDAFGHWVREYAIDGFRVDAAWGMRQRNPHLWSQMLAELRRVDPELWFLAEASAHDGHYVDSGFDAAYDWTPRVGRWSWENLFDDPNAIGPRLDVVLDSGGTPPHQVARFLNNNDTGERFITRYGVDTTRVAATLLLTLPGIPVLYTGDEVGAQYLPYSTTEPLRWDDPHELRPLYEKLVDLRERIPGLAATAWTRVRTDRPSTYAYLRHRADGSDPVLVVLEFGGGGPVELSFDAVPDGFDERRPMLDLLENAVVSPRYRSSGGLQFDMSPTSAMILQPSSQGS